jgi:maltooligosyltrehalose synthase
VGAEVRRADTPRSRLIRTALQVRREYAPAFDGGYEPLDLGEQAIGFVRGGQVATVVPRFGPMSLPDVAGPWETAHDDGVVKLLVRR